MNSKRGFTHLIVLALAALALLAACSPGPADSPDNPTVSATRPAATPTAPVETPDAVEPGGETDESRPPMVVLTVNGDAVAGHLGSYCWSGPEDAQGQAVAVCADAIGIPTAAEPVAAAAPIAATVDVFGDRRPSAVNISVYATGDGATELTGFAGEGRRHWIPEGTAVFSADVAPNEAFTLDLPAGEYLVSAFIRWVAPGGDAGYGFLIEAVTGAVGAPPATSTAVGAATTEPPCLAPHPVTRGAPIRAARVAFQRNGDWVVWQEEDGAVRSLGLPGDAFDPRFSDDGRYLAYRRVDAAGAHTVWVADADGQGARQVLALDDAVTRQRYPEAVDITFDVFWLPNTHLIGQRAVPHFDALGEFPMEELHVTDVDNGSTDLVAPGDTVWATAFSPDGRFIAVLTEGTIHLLEPATNRQLEVTADNVPADRDQALAFAPNGAYLAVYDTEGVLLIDTQSGATAHAPLSYEPIGLGHSSALPPLAWAPDATAVYTAILNGGDPFAPDANFTVWKIEAPDGAAQQLDTYHGAWLSVAFAPAGRILSYWTQLDNQRTLFLADAEGDRLVEYARGGPIEFLGWGPDGVAFLYRDGMDGALMLGDTCGAPQQATAGAIARLPAWVDAHRFVAATDEPDKGIAIALHDRGGGEPKRVAELTGESPEFIVYLP